MVFFSSWQDLGNIVVIGTISYLALVMLLRFYGKRTLASLNMFDWIVSVALGSTLASAILSKDVAISDAVVAFATLMTLQFVISWLSVRFPPVRRIIRADPALLLYKGKFLEKALESERVTREEIYTVVRREGHSSINQVDAVILETNGSFSIIADVEAPESELMQELKNHDDLMNHHTSA